ncbi:MAG TPA: chorismate mutase, partial [Candidatus Sulfotelmatobacter sp.]|nr:chorismate mutase [Candidatus Sulfotelmatobacter sp.]
IASAWFTTTSDLRSEFPAVAARRLGWTDVPLMCAHEMNVVDGNPRNVPRCIRVLIHVNSERSQREMRFVYLRRATTIREEVNRDRERSGEGVRTTVPS